MYGTREWCIRSDIGGAQVHYANVVVCIRSDIGGAPVHYANVVVCIRSDIGGGERLETDRRVKKKKVGLKNFGGCLRPVSGVDE